MRVGAGFYEAGGERLAAIRDAIADDTTGPALKRVLTKLEKAGFEIGGERLKTSPRGYDADHPRIELLRHKQIVASRSYGFGKEISTPRPAGAGARRLAGAAAARQLARSEPITP